MRLLLTGLALPALLLGSVRITASGADHLAFVYEPGEPAIEISSDGRQQVTFPDADNLAQPGELDLPCKLVRVGIPQTGTVSYDFELGEEQALDNVTLNTVVRMSYQPDTFWYEPVAVIATGAAPAVEVGRIEELRGVRFVTVRVWPARYDHVRRQLTALKSVTVHLRFTRPAQVNRDPDPLDGCLVKMLLNGEQAVDWKLHPPTERANPYARSTSWLKVLVDSTAVYGITGRELAAAGVPVSGLDPVSLALFTAVRHEPNRVYPDTLTPVPILVTGEDDGRLDPDDRVVFYGLGPSLWVGRDSAYLTNLYTRHNVYWLTWGGPRGARMQSGLAPETTGVPVVRVGRDILHREQDLDCPARSGLLWIWTQVFKARDREMVSFSTELGLSSPAAVTGIRGSLIAESTDNELTVRLNGRAAGTCRFGQSPPAAPYQFRLDTTLPLNSGANRLDLELRGPGQKRVYLDYVEVEYLRRLSLFEGQLHFLADDTGTFRYRLAGAREMPFVLDVTDHYAPRLVQGMVRQDDSAAFCLRSARPAEFAAACPGQLRRPVSATRRSPGRLVAAARQADYWVVAPGSFNGAAQVLGRYRTGRLAGIAQGRADVAVLEDVYDDYAFGMEEPAAVKRFFADKQPAYGLLVGDATCDYRNILGRGVEGVPAYEYGLGLNPDALDRTAAAFDAWYADFEGEGASPDMILGRVTSRTPEAFRRYVDKVIAYESGPVGFWNKRFILLADDEFSGDPNRPDPIGFTHINQCEAMAVLPDNLLEPVKVYLTEHGFAGVRNKPGANDELMRQLNRGGLLFVFFGHGSGFDLTHESVLNISRVPMIRNEGRVPFCYFGSCSVGRFEDTQFECIAEDMVRMDGGAIATVGATKATTSASNQVFARNLLTPLVSMPDSTIGYSFFQAWPTDRIYHLFGDPAVILRLPRASTQSLAVVPDTLQPGRVVRAHTIVEQPRGRYDWTLFGPRRVRAYRSTRGEAVYSLPGLELGRGSDELREGTVDLRATVPVWSGFDTLFVANGYFAPVTRSCRLSASVWTDSADLSVLRDTLAFLDSAFSSLDSTGPAVSFLADGRLLADQAVVPDKFEVEVTMQDESGLLIAPMPGSAPVFYVNDRQSGTDLTDLMVFDDGSSSRARYRTNLSLSGPVDSLCAIVSDNQLNRTFARVVVRARSSAVLQVESVLVYPNPVRSSTRFTFLLNAGAQCRVRVYTLAGRLVRDLGDHAGSFGFNEVFWDGRDRDGGLLPNGVYLFSLDCRTFGPKTSHRVQVRDRLLVLRDR